MAASCSAGDGDHRLSNTLQIIDGALNLAIPSFLPSCLPAIFVPSAPTGRLHSSRYFVKLYLDLSGARNIANGLDRCVRPALQCCLLAATSEPKQTLSRLGRSLRSSCLLTIPPRLTMSVQMQVTSLPYLRSWKIREAGTSFASFSPLAVQRPVHYRGAYIPHKGVAKWLTN